MARKSELVKVERLAEIFGCSARQVQLFASRDGMPKAKHGMYDLVQCVRWRIAFLENQVAAQAKQPSTDDELKLSKEQARKARVEADLKEITLRERRGELIPLALYRESMANKIATARQCLLSIPSNLAHHLVGLELIDLKLKLREGIRKALTDLSGPEMEQVSDGDAGDGTASGNA